MNFYIPSYLKFCYKKNLIIKENTIVKVRKIERSNNSIKEVTWKL